MSYEQLFSSKLARLLLKHAQSRYHPPFDLNQTAGILGMLRSLETKRLQTVSKKMKVGFLCVLAVCVLSSVYVRVCLF